MKVSNSLIIFLDVIVFCFLEDIDGLQTLFSCNNYTVDVSYMFYKHLSKILTKLENIESLESRSETKQVNRKNAHYYAGFKKISEGHSLGANALLRN